MTQEELKEVGIDFEQELYKAFGQVKDFSLGMRIAKHFFYLGMSVSNKELEEKRERFRLYGEICLLMEEQDEDIFDLLTVSRYGMSLEHEIVVKMENGDSGEFRGIQFEDGMLWVMFGTEQIAFVCVLSESLKEIFEALKNYFMEEKL